MRAKIRFDCPCSFPWFIQGRTKHLTDHLQNMKNCIELQPCTRKMTEAGGLFLEWCPMQIWLGKKKTIRFHAATLPVSSHSGKI